MGDQSKILLSQQEIDALVTFLTSNQERLGGEVLDQFSVDKLIYLLKTIDDSKFKFNINAPIASEDTSRDQVKGMLAKHGVKDGEKLGFKINEETQYIELVKMSNSEEELSVFTPESIENSDNDVKGEVTTWGYSIAPVLFDNIANIFNLRYTKATFDGICELYAIKNFGDKESKIPEIFMPSSTSMFKNLIV